MYPEVDISKVTPKIAIDMGIKGQPELPAEMFEELIKVANQEETVVKNIEVIIVEPITAVPPIEASNAKVASMEPPAAVEVVKELERVKEELAPKKSEAPIVIL